MKYEKERYQIMADIVKAMSHPTRMYIVDELNIGEKCVRDLTEMIGDDISTVSKHLSKLKSAGIVKSEKRGNCVYYQLMTPCVMSFFNCVINVIEKKNDLGKVTCACEQ